MSKSILIIEDEFYFRQALKKYVNACSDEFEVCAEASDGMDGLKKLLDIKPDIALVDITMPVMDGITLIEKGKEAGCKTKMIILTGYAEFEYAKKAIHLGVQDYLLKPIQYEDLYKSLQEVGSAIDLERERENTLSFVSGKKQEMFSAYKENLISRLLHNEEYNESELEKNFNFNKNGHIYTAAILDISIEDANTDVRNKSDMKLYRYDISNILDGVFKESMNFGTCVNEAGALCIVFESDRETRPEPDFKERMKQVCDGARDSLGLIIVAYFGSPKTSLNEVGESYNEAQALKKYHLFSNKKGVYFYSDSRPSFQSSERYFTHEDRKQLFSLMRAGDHGKVNALIRKTFSKMSEGNLDLDTVCMHFIDLFSAISNFAAEYQAGFEEFNENSMLLSRIISASSLEELQKFVIDATDWIIDRIALKNGDSQTKLAQKIANYIDANFANPNLKLKIIAEEFYTSSQYLCLAFKNHQKTTIGKYILDVRMNNAKKEFIGGATNITLVAYHCGYEDIGYFSKCFKRYFGVSPKKFIEML